MRLPYFSYEICRNKKRTMNLKLILVALTALLAHSAFSQKGYNQYIQEEGLKFGTKWGYAKDAEGNRKRALLIGIENTNKEPVTYEYTINLYYEGMLRESGAMALDCIDGLKSRIGKLNGIYFIPQKFTDEQLGSSDFNFTIENLEVIKVDACTEETAE